MQTLTLTIPGPMSGAEAADIRTIMVGISGIARVHVDVVSRSATVEFDPVYVTEEHITNALTGSGYANDGVSTL